VARIAGVVAVVVSAFILLGPLQAGLSGAFLANILGSALSLLMLIPVLRQLRLSFSLPQLRDMLRIGLPYVPTGIAGLLIHLIDRNLLIRMPAEDIERIYGAGMQASDVVGIYGRVVAFGVLLQLMIQVFRFAWQPFFLQHSNDPEAKRLFRHVLSISTMLTMVVALAATFFVPDLVRHHWGGRLYLLPPTYWIGLSVLPLIFSELCVRHGFYQPFGRYSHYRKHPLSSCSHLCRSGGYGFLLLAAYPFERYGRGGLGYCGGNGCHELGDGVVLPQGLPG